MPSIADGVPHYGDESVTLHHGDCLDVLRELADCSVDSIVTDPPYGLGFMGKAWDDLPPGVEWAAECLRVLKPGGHMLAFGGSRTWHRLAAAVEDAGFEIRDSIAWLYGSGFPKSLDVSKAIDKAAGAEREGRRAFTVRGGMGGGRAGWTTQQCESCGRTRGSQAGNCHCPDTAPATPAAERWQGWGTALKPAFEPVVVGRKPLVGTVAQNVLEHGTGALNIDGCRVAGDVPQVVQGGRKINGGRYNDSDGAEVRHTLSQPHTAGRWPANVVLDESQAAELDQQSGTLTSGTNAVRRKVGTFLEHGGLGKPGDVQTTYGDTGGASRFFYVAKAPKSERPRTDDGTAHPTVKPLALMRWLVRLVTPPGGVVLEPFAGSGTTVEACLLEGFQCIAIEREADYLPLIEARIARVAARPVEDTLSLFDLDGLGA